MPNIANLPPANDPLTGEETVVAIQGGVAVRIDVDQIAARASGLGVAEVTQAELDAVAETASAAGDAAAAAQTAAAQKMPNTATAMASALADTNAAGRADFRAAGSISTHAGPVANEAAMLSVPVPIRVGDTVKRLDTGTDWRCDALPSSTLANWRNLGVSAVAAAPPITVAPGATLTRDAHFNRAVICPGGALTVNTAGSAIGDYLHFWNSSTVTPLVITIAGLTITVAPNDTALAENTGGAANAGWRDAGADASTLSGVTYHPTTGKITGYTLSGVAYAVTYPNATTIVHSGGGRVVTITLDATSGKVVGKVVA